MLVLVVRQGWHVGRSVAQCPSACVCLSRPPWLLGTHHTREEDDSRDGCQVERGPECNALGHPFQASRPETKLPSRAVCQLAYSITLALACKIHALSCLPEPHLLLLLLLLLLLR